MATKEKQVAENNLPDTEKQNTVDEELSLLTCEISLAQKNIGLQRSFGVESNRNRDGVLEAARRILATAATPEIHDWASQIITDTNQRDVWRAMRRDCDADTDEMLCMAYVRSVSLRIRLENAAKNGVKP